MPIRVTLDEMLARRGMKAREVAATVGNSLRAAAMTLSPAHLVSAHG